jgi:uncharacterized protein YqjF (DUF2071 family)
LVVGRFEIHFLQLLDHASVTVRDIERAKAFYKAIWRPTSITIDQPGLSFVAEAGLLRHERPAEPSPWNVVRAGDKDPRLSERVASGPGPVRFVVGQHRKVTVKSESLQARPFLTAEWRRLAMVNFAIAPELLAPLVPVGTELDLWDGQALVSVVGFRFLRTRVMGIGFPLHRNFEEVNLRFYVRRDHCDGARRGVVFVKELVPRRAIAALARYLYNENYLALPMSHHWHTDADGSEQANYRWQQAGAFGGVGVRTIGAPRIPESGSLQEFITEHYWGYVRQRDGSTVEYQVEHPRWRVWCAADAHFFGDIALLYGSEFVPALSASPVSAFLADGSAIVVRRGRRLDEGVFARPTRRGRSETEAVCHDAVV